MSVTFAPAARTAFPATERQVAFAAKLAAERGVECPVLTDKRQASAVIESLLAMPRVRVAAGAAEVPAATVPAGHYATPSRTGNNDLDFWRVDRPESGRWAGRIFVKRVIGGRADTPVRGAEAQAALAAIEASGVDAAGALYGQRIGRCCKCNRTLTDDVSRQLGIGPTCRG
jgi:hypothetical protein